MGETRKFWIKLIRFFCLTNRLKYHKLHFPFKQREWFLVQLKCVLYCTICYSHCFELVIGALAIVVANPTDLVKVRLQAEGQLPSGVPRRYAGAMDAYSTIVRQVRPFSMSCFFFFCSFLYVENILIVSISILYIFWLN